MKRMNIIVAVDDKNAIGYKNELLYHISDDLKRFKALTAGNVVIMGKNTFESLPKGALPARKNVVLCDEPGYQAPGCEVWDDFDKCLNHYREGEKDIFIIGGASVYRQAMERMRFGDNIFLTRIYSSDKDADTYFPDFDGSRYMCNFESDLKTDDKENVKYRFLTLTKVKYNTVHKIFLSLPFTGQEDTLQQRVDDARDFIKNILRHQNKVEYEIVTQSNIDDIIEAGASLVNDDYANEMIHDLISIVGCNAILMCKGWENSKGCKLEWEAAKVFGKRIFYMN